MTWVSCNQFITSMLPVCYQYVTSMLPVCYQYVTSMLSGFQEVRPMTASSRPSTAKSLGPSNPYPDLPSLNERVGEMNKLCSNVVVNVPDNGLDFNDIIARCEYITRTTVSTRYCICCVRFLGYLTYISSICTLVISV